jgi:Ca2+-binding EF-hand superfamily protein
MKNIILAFFLLGSISLGACSHYGGKGHHGGKKMHKKIHEKFKKMDSDGDGAVSRVEFDKAHGEKFEKMDSNKDGKITMEEKKAYKMAMKKEKKECCK